MTDDPDLLRVAVVAPIGNSDHSSLSAVISMALAVPNCKLLRNFSCNIKSIGIQSVVQHRISPGEKFGLLTIMSRFRTNICPCWLDVKYQLRRSVFAARISLGLMINAGALLASSSRLIFGDPVISLGSTRKSCPLSSESK